jgi:hypothetical protein
MVAMRSEMFAEHPHLFFMHFFMHSWANDNAVKSARSLRAARSNSGGQDGVNTRRQVRERSQRFQGVGR